MQSSGFGTLDFDIKLTYIERFAIFLDIAAYVLLFLSAGQAEAALREQEAGLPTPPSGGISPRTAVEGAVVSLVATVILTIIATIRLKEREQRLQTGQETAPLYPNINITLGSWISTIGTVLFAVGIIQRERQLAPVTIV